MPGAMHQYKEFREHLSLHRSAQASRDSERGRQNPSELCASVVSSRASGGHLIVLPERSSLPHTEANHTRMERPNSSIPGKSGMLSGSPERRVWAGKKALGRLRRPPPCGRTDEVFAPAPLHTIDTVESGLSRPPGHGEAGQLSRER